MAVVQISRIQHRRGRKNVGSGLPQLSSGELGWAIDTQELYIGNGAVSEGAPQVGNTKILTEGDDILSLAGQYAYKRDEIQTGISIGSPVERTLTQKLDDVVSVKDFGAAGDGTDQTAAFQRAVDQLFINNATKGIYSSRVTLRIPAGEYLLSQSIKVPPFANIVGDGIDKVYINSSGTNVFKTVNELSVPGTYSPAADTDSNNMARGIVIKGMTINHTSYGGALKLENCKDSIFEDLRFTAGWSTNLSAATDGISDEGHPDSNLVAIVISNGSVATASSDNNKFTNITYEGYATCVYSDFDTLNNIFDIGRIYDCGIGFVLGADDGTPQASGQQLGPYYNTITNYNFELIARHGIWCRRGKYNISRGNRYLNVGNDGGNAASIIYPNITFIQSTNNSTGDYFERTYDRTVNASFNATGTYVPEIEGQKSVHLDFPVSTRLGTFLTGTPAVYLCASEDRGIIEVDYKYTAEVIPGPVLRKGKWTIVYNKDNGEVSFSDAHMFTGNPSKSGNLTFTAQTAISGNKIVIEALNTTLDAINPEDDEFEFTIKYFS